MQTATPGPSARNVPTVDLLDVVSDAPARQLAASAAIREGFSHFGLLYIRNHGIDRAALDAMFDAFLGLTARPEAEKRALARPDIWYQRGWTPPNTERAVVAGGQPDFKECYFASPTEPDPEGVLQYPQLYADNVWPDGDTTLRPRFLAIGRALDAIGRTLLRGCARALDIPVDQLERVVQGGPHVTRALLYLPLTQDQVGSGILWGEEHTDFNLITLLPGGRFLDSQGATCARPDDQSGLYLRTRPTPEAPSGTLVSGTPPAGCIVAQVGQQLEILTGGTFLATPHVITAPKVPGYSRASLAHFVHLRTDEVLYPLAPFRTSEAIRAYRPPVLVGNYSIKTLVDIGLAPPSALDRLGYRHYDRLESMRARLP
jgi:isopenicillin N synthase-like dioxygenase